MKLLEIIVWMGAAAQVYHCPSALKQFVVTLDGVVIGTYENRPRPDPIKIAIESKL